MGFVKKHSYFLLCLIALYSIYPALDQPEAQAAKSRIAFISRPAGEARNSIYIMDEDGENVRRLTFEHDSGASWSPDGDSIVFSRHVDGGAVAGDIYVIGADGSNMRRIVKPNAHEGSPSWSPDGRKIAYTVEWDIYVMDVSGRNVRDLTNDGAFNMVPAWSPDSRKIAFVSIRDENRDIYVMDANGENVQRLTNWDNGYVNHPAWSPDGLTIAFAGISESGQTDIYVMDTDGANVRRLTDHPDYDTQPDWLDDGRIVFVSGRDGNSEIYVMGIDGGNLRNLTNNPERDAQPACWPGYLSGLAVESAHKLYSTWGWIK